MLPAALRAAALCGLTWVTAACSHLGSVAFGPIVTRPSGHERSFGDELRLRRGAGSSEGNSLTVVEAQARLAIAGRVSALLVGAGPAHVHWAGPIAFTLRAAPMLGVQYFDETVFASAGAHGGLGLGVTLAESERKAPSWYLIELPPPKSDSELVVRERTLLTLELSGAADAQARGATLSAGVLVGLAWSEEQRERPLLPWRQRRGAPQWGFPR